ncbi:MAG: hypothetical protein ACRC8S_15215 [Fimbriiglobus sp.]
MLRISNIFLRFVVKCWCPAATASSSEQERGMRTRNNLARLKTIPGTSATSLKYALIADSKIKFHSKSARESNRGEMVYAVHAIIIYRVVDAWPWERKIVITDVFLDPNYFPSQSTPHNTSNPNDSI